MMKKKKKGENCMYWSDSLQLDTARREGKTRGRSGSVRNKFAPGEQPPIQIRDMSSGFGTVVFAWTPFTIVRE